MNRFSIPCGFIALIWLLYTSVLLFLPQVTDPVQGITMKNFNFNSILTGAIVVLAAVYWYLPKSLGGASHRFTGPNTTVVLSKVDML